MASIYSDHCKHFIRKMNTFSMSRPKMSNLVQLYLMLEKINKIGTWKMIGQYLQNGSQSSILEMNLINKL